MIDAIIEYLAMLPENKVFVHGMWVFGAAMVWAFISGVVSGVRQGLSERRGSAGALYGESRSTADAGT